MGRRIWAVGAVMSVLWCVGAAGEAKEDAAPKTDAVAATEDDPLHGWQIFFGAANLWPKLDESEAKINRLMNNGLGRLFPRWEDPTTFRDWRNQFKLWDFQLGASRAMNEHLDLYFSVVGVYEYQPNSKVYFPLGVPLKINIEFERAVIFASSGLDYYPWGKPELPEGAGHSVWERIKAAKPYGELNLTYIDLKGRAEATFNLPAIGKIGHYQDKARYDLIEIGSRIGFDVPITRHDSISFAVGPMVFTSHEHEFDNLNFCTTLRHRF